MAKTTVPIEKKVTRDLFCKIYQCLKALPDIPIQQVMNENGEKRTVLDAWAYDELSIFRRNRQLLEPAFFEMVDFEKHSTNTVIKYGEALKTETNEKSLADYAQKIADEKKKIADYFQEEIALPALQKLPVSAVKEKKFPGFQLQSVFFDYLVKE